jgi:hypothetical protein
VDQTGGAIMNAAVLRLHRSSPFGGIITRATLLVPLAMALWWYLLKGASLWLLRVLAWLPLALLIGPAGIAPIHVNPDTGDWVFNVSVNKIVTNPRTGEHQQIDSVEFATEQDNVAFFACGWFSYLALALSAGFSRKQARRALWGAGLLTVMNILCLAAYAYINAAGSLVNTPAQSDGVWLYKYCYHIIYLVVPFAGPFLVALVVHPEWRAYFRLTEPRSPSPSPALGSHFRSANKLDRAHSRTK